MLCYDLEVVMKSNYILSVEEICSRLSFCHSNTLADSFKEQTDVEEGLTQPKLNWFLHK